MYIWLSLSLSLSIYIYIYQVGLLFLCECWHIYAKQKKMLSPWTLEYWYPNYSLFALCVYNVRWIHFFAKYERLKFVYLIFWPMSRDKFCVHKRNTLYFCIRLNSWLRSLYIIQLTKQEVVQLCNLQVLYRVPVHRKGSVGNSLQFTSLTLILILFSHLHIFRFSGLRSKKFSKFLHAPFSIQGYISLSLPPPGYLDNLNPSQSKLLWTGTTSSKLIFQNISNLLISKAVIKWQEFMKNQRNSLY
jgi:hypothetical protein